MGNTCGSCSFDSRGSEFDMEPKDKYVPSDTFGSNPPVRMEEANIMSSNVISKQQIVKENTPNDQKIPFSYDPEDKENISQLDNVVVVEQEVVEKEILGESKQSNILKQNDDFHEYHQVDYVSSDYKEDQVEQEEQPIEDQEEVQEQDNDDTSFEFLQPPYYD